MRNSSPLLAHLKNDVPASVVVFLVALPLCLGIAMASGGPPISGVIAGIIGGIVVGALSHSQLGVSGPAAGLVVIVLHAIAEVGSYELFLCSVILAGLMQIALGIIRAGVLAYYFPSSVIKGMLAGIGIIIILKQIPHAVGYNVTFEGDLSFWQTQGENTLSTLSTMLNFVNIGSIIIAVVCLAILIVWELPFMKGSKAALIPGPLLAVLVGVALAQTFQNTEALRLGTDFFVTLPSVSFDNVLELLPRPDLNGFTMGAIWKTAATIAVVASLETLLCVEATDKMDPEKRVTPPNRELLAQGVGNTLAGLIGGLPITQVVVRSSANLQSGGKTKLSAILHGGLLLLSLLLIPGFLRMIPLSSLAAILLLVGYKLTKPVMFLEMFAKGKSQFIPFVVTIVGVVFTDLLTGVLIGLMVGMFSILYANYKIPFYFDSKAHIPGTPVRIELSESVSFLNKARIWHTLQSLPSGAQVQIDATRNINLDPDIEEIIRDAAFRAPSQGVTIELIGFDNSDQSLHPTLLQSFQKHVEATTTQFKI